MRKSLLAAGLLAATLVGTGGIVYAQQSPGSQPGAPPGAGNPPPPPPGGPNGGTPGGGMMNGTVEMAPGSHHPPHGMMNPMMMAGPAAGRDMEEGMMMRMHPPKGAVFMFRDGDQRVLIKCADDEPTKACVDGAATLIEKLDGASGTGGSGTQDQDNQGQGNQNQ